MAEAVVMDERGHDRGRSMRAGGQIPVRQLRASAIGLASLGIVVAILSHLSGLALDARTLAIVGASLATALTFALAWLNLLAYRLAGDPRSLYIAVAAVCLGTFPLTLGVVVPSVVDPPALDGLRAAFALAAVPALVGVGLASRSLESVAGGSPRRVVTALVASTLVVAAACTALPWVRSIDTDPGVPLPLAGPLTSGLIVAGFAAIVLVHLVAARRQSGQSLSWTPTAPGGVGTAYAITAATGAAAQPFAWLLIAVAVAVGLYGAAAELNRHHGADQRRAFEAVVGAFEATARAQAVHDAHAETRHEAHSALLGIEAAALSLSRHRALLTAADFDELTNGLVAEVHRLRSLIEERARQRSTFDLREVIVPVVSCLRADGLDVRSSIGPGIEVEGLREHTAQVLLSLLTNAKRHAPGSPVEVRAELGDEHVTVYVEDRGPGVPKSFQESVFQRGTQARGREGSGLGLFISRRLMEEQNASISLESRPGGGSSFVLRFPAGAST